MKILITGDLGLIGKEAVSFYLGNQIIGIDNNQRSRWFNTQEQIAITQKGYKHRNVDIRDYEELEVIFSGGFDYVLHFAAQCSHDFAAKIPIEDFQVNALGTLNILELTRKYCPNAVLITMSTNKVYGSLDDIPLRRLEKRYVPPIGLSEGFDETTNIDQTTHSLFGVSKIASDLYTQEYGRYFGMKTGVFRGGCLTGPKHTGTELHGFLNYLVKCAKYDLPYRIFGSGAQVRDNIHANDLVVAFEEFRKNPKPGEVYNIGGGTHSNCSILEAIDIINDIREARNLPKWTNYTIEENNWRKGDHKWYISDVSKFKSDYPNWNYTYTLQQIIKEIYEAV